MENVFNIPVLLSIIGALVVVTNIIVQVLKNLTWDKLPTNILAVIYGTDVSSVLRILSNLQHYC